MVFACMEDGHTKQGNHDEKAIVFLAVMLMDMEVEVNRNNVKKAREKILMGKSELSRKAKISSPTIDRIEKGYPCRLETKRKIIKALGYKLSERAEVFPEG